MSVKSRKVKPSPPVEPMDRAEAIPALKDGDRLTRDEFERRYDAMPDLKKAELIEGVVHVPSPVRCGHHGEPHSSLGGWLFIYRARTPGVRAADNTSVRMDVGNMPQPDCALFIDPGSGGQARIDEDDYLNGGPELVAEVAASSAKYDLHEKPQAFQRNGVREYIVWRTDDGALDWFALRGEVYKQITPEPDGTLHSTVYRDFGSTRPR
jgi:Uma2 family endonuclease